MMTTEQMAKEVSRIGSLAEQTARAADRLEKLGHRGKMDLDPIANLCERGMRICFALKNEFLRRKAAAVPVGKVVRGSRKGLPKFDVHGRKWAVYSAVAPSDSIREDHLVCLEDGMEVKMLKRHLAVGFGLTPEQYRERWKLREDYPMAAPAFSRSKSEFAKSVGLGKNKPVEAPKARRRAREIA